MAPTETEAREFAILLRDLKDTYGWKSLVLMPKADLLILLRRSLRTEGQGPALSAFEGWIQIGLLTMLSTPSRQREKSWAGIASALGWPEREVSLSLKILDQTLALSKADRRHNSFQAGFIPSGRQPSTELWKQPLLVGLATLILVGGFTLAIQLVHYRDELRNQREKTEEQQGELDGLKLELQKETDEENIAQPSQDPPTEVPEPLLRPALPDEPLTQRPVPPRPQSDPTPVSESSTSRWNGCEQAVGEGAAPQSGDMWWPVVGPPNSLEDARRYCRSDAFRNSEGNVQIASFRSQSDAYAFAQQLTADSQHPYVFRVGEPTTYD